MTKKGKTTAGAQGCIDHRCKSCCTDTFHEAITNNRPRDPCKAHKLDSAKDRALSGPSGSSSAAVILSGRSQAASHALIPPSQPDPIVATSSYASTEPQASGSVSSSQNNPPHTTQTSTTRTRGLAQPVGPNWVRNKQSADADRDRKINDIKARRSQMDEAVKRTAELVIYFKV